jgi:hypothetical protein
MMVYMVHLTNQMARKAPIPNIDEILKTNPDIARQLATAAMQQQSQGMKQQQQAAPPPTSSFNPLAGLSSFMSSMVPPPPQQTSVRPPPPTFIKSPVKVPRPNPQPNIQRATIPEAPPVPSREMNAPPMSIDDLLKSVNANIETKKVSTTPKKGGSTGKNSVSIKL